MPIEWLKASHPPWYIHFYPFISISYLYVNVCMTYLYIFHHLFYFSSYVEACALLLSSGAKVDEEDDDAWTPLCLAAEEGHLETCKVLLSHGATESGLKMSIFLHFMTYLENAKEDSMMEWRCIWPWRLQVSIPDEDLRSPLWWATWRQHMELVELLLEHGADLLQSDRWGVTPKSILQDRGTVQELARPHRLS